MKVLYAAFRYDPRDINRASGVDYNFYSAMKRAGMEVRVVGPFPGPFPAYEHAIRKAYHAVTGKRYLKWDLTSTWRASRQVNHFEKSWNPDVVFTLFPPTLAFYRGQAPCIFNTDTTFQGWQEGGANFGRLPLKIQVWEERRAIHHSARIIVFSEWCKQEIIRRHAVRAERIEKLAMPAALPFHSVPRNLAIEEEKRLDIPIRLLLVGRDYHRKGIDIGLQVVDKLNLDGVPAELRICGVDGQDTDIAKFVGVFRKSIPEELEQYAGLYRWAHFLIHPARFDPSPIVPAEAAAFGTPCISNDVGGIATSVKHGVSGFVLPGGSPAKDYVEVIKHYCIDNPEAYYVLCQSARMRYEQEQNWEVAGKRVVSIIEDVVEKSSELAVSEADTL